MADKIDDPMEEFENAFLTESAVVTSHGVKFFDSQRGGKIAVFEYYMYVKNHVMKTGRVYYNCRGKSSGCKGSLTLDVSGEVYGTAAHDHLADPREVEAEIHKAEFRKRAQHSHTKPRKLYSELVQKLPTDVTGLLPAAHNMARIARRQRKMHLPTPHTRREIDLPSYFEKSDLLGPDSVLFDSGNNDPNRIIIFKAEDFDYLQQAENWIMDGTFKIVPELFTQLYTIHVELFGGVFPVLFALLPDKSGPTYDRLFRVVREALEKIPFVSESGNVDYRQKPYNIVVDYELAVINSVSKIFPRTTLQGNFSCYFRVLRISIYSRN